MICGSQHEGRSDYITATGDIIPVERDSELDNQQDAKDNWSQGTKKCGTRGVKNSGRKKMNKKYGKRIHDSERKNVAKREMPVSPCKIKCKDQISTANLKKIHDNY
jgi:hypothetical protein